MFTGKLYISGIFKPNPESTTHTIQARLVRNIAAPSADTAGSPTPILTQNVVDFQFTCEAKDVDGWKSAVGKFSEEVTFTFSA